MHVLSILLWAISGIGLALLAAVCRLAWLLGSISATLRGYEGRLIRLERDVDDLQTRERYRR